MDSIKKNNKVSLIIIGIFIILVATLLCLLILNRGKESKEETKIIIKSSDIINAIEKMDNDGKTEYAYTPYVYLNKTDKIIKSSDLDLITMLYFSSKFNINYLDALNNVFNKTYTKDDVKNNSEVSTKVTFENDNLQFDLSYSEWDKSYHKIYNTVEENNKLEIYEYVVYSYGGLPDGENIYKIFKLDYDKNEYNIPVNENDLIVVLDYNDENTIRFNIEDYKEQATKVKWTFAKNSNGSYTFTSIEIIE